MTLEEMMISMAVIRISKKNNSPKTTPRKRASGQVAGILRQM